jgi:hypothetical protein
LTALLLLLAVLGLAAAAVLAYEGSLGSATRGSQAAQMSLPGSSSGGPAGDITAAASSTCRADYEAVTAAAGSYEALKGKPPSDISALAAYMKDPVTSSYFAISVGSGGKVLVATPDHPAVSGDGNCAYAGIG